MLQVTVQHKRDQLFQTAIPAIVINRYKDFLGKKERNVKIFCIFVLRMSRKIDIVKPVLKRKLVTALFVGLSLAAFATLGEGGKKSVAARGKNFLSARSATYNYRSFSLKSGYNYRGNAFLNTERGGKFVMLNTVMTYQKGNATYILPLKKKLLLNGKVTFRPTAPQR